jgi:hypothetical protein
LIRVFLTSRKVNLRFGSKALRTELPVLGREADIDIPKQWIGERIGGQQSFAAPCAGGMTFNQARKLIHGLVKKGRVVGMDVVEITPSTDVNQITSVTAGRLIVNFVGAAVRAGYFDRRR